MGNAPESMIDPNGEQFGGPSGNLLEKGMGDVNNEDFANFNRVGRIMFGDGGPAGSGGGSVFNNWGYGTDRSAIASFWAKIESVARNTTGDTTRQGKGNAAGNLVDIGFVAPNSGGSGGFEIGVIGTTTEALQGRQLKADNLYEAKGGPNTPENIAFWNASAEFWYNVMPYINILNFLKKTFTGTNLDGVDMGQPDMLEAVGPPIGRMEKLSQLRRRRQR